MPTPALKVLAFHPRFRAICGVYTTSVLYARVSIEYQLIKVALLHDRECSRKQ